MGIHLREKKMANGQISFYLDIYHNKKRWYEFLDIHITKNRPTQEDKDKRKLAQEIRAQRENELIVQGNGLTDKGKRKADFIEWYGQYVKERNLKGHRNETALKHLKEFTKGRSVPFEEITHQFIKDFSRHLLGKMGNNTAADYVKNISTALDEAVRRDIIVANPIRKIPRHEKIKRVPVFHDSFTLDELQLLSDTECNIHPQFRQAFLFSCFSGLRWSDVNMLRWSEIIEKTIDDCEQWFLHFQQEKTDAIEYLPLSAQAIVILKERRQTMIAERSKSTYVFPHVKEPVSGKNIKNARINYALKKWAIAAGLDPKRMHFHVARHSFATNVLENSPDADLWTVSKLLGHKSIKATQMYAHVRDSRKKAAISGLPALRNPSKAA